MKLLLGIDLTDKNNKDMDGLPFVTRRLSEPLEREYDRLCAEEAQFKKKSSLPAVLRFIRSVAGISTVAIPCVLLEDCSGSGRNKSGNASAVSLFLGIGAIMFLIWLILTLIEAKRARSITESSDFLSVKDESDALSLEAKKDLGVPENAVDMDLLASRYHWVNGEMYSVTSRLVWTYGNISFSAWREADCFCFADTTMRFDVPLDAFRGAEKIKKGYYITAWNKPDSFRSPEYKPYRIHIVNGEICPVGYLAVQLEHMGENYELRVPMWEEDALRRITGWAI